MANTNSGDGKKKDLSTAESIGLLFLVAAIAVVGHLLEEHSIYSIGK